jgi:uncharacterized protein with HEPN domain
MQRESKKYLYDIAQAAELITRFTTGKSFANYLSDPMLRAAVERKFEVIGEALVQLSKRDAAAVARIGEYQRIIAFRNILIHGYADVDVNSCGALSKASLTLCGWKSRHCSASRKPWQP